MARQFAEVLRELGGGGTYDELTAKLKPNGDAGVIVTDEIKTKVLEAARGDTVFFVTAGGSLVRQDPRQQDLPLRTAVPGGAA